MKGKRIVRKYLIHSPFKSLVKTTRYKKLKYTARTLFKSEGIHRATMGEALRAIQAECELLCKRAPSPSQLRTAPVRRLEQFRWDEVEQELTAKAPTLLSVLQTAAGSEATTPAIVMATAILLKSRSLCMCKLQAIVGSLLYSGHASKRVCFTVAYALFC